MFRIKNDTSNTASGNGLQKIKNLASSHAFKIGLTALILVASYFTWTHGRLLPGQWNKEVQQAQASSPLPPEWLARYFGRDYCLRLDYCGPDADPDRDAMTNWAEFLYFTDPANPDTNNDGVTDGEHLTKLENPLGYGSLDAARDVEALGEYNPLADALVEEGVGGIQSGEIMTLDQIAYLAERIKDLPAFEDVPFKVSDENSQAKINLYKNQLTQVTAHFYAAEGALLGEAALDSTNLTDLTSYLDAVTTYHTALVYVDIPSDALAFHKSLFGSLVFNALMANGQKEFLEGIIEESEVQTRTQLYGIYYTRYLQEMSKASQALKAKYDFEFSF